MHRLCGEESPSLPLTVMRRLLVACDCLEMHEGFCLRRHWGKLPDGVQTDASRPCGPRSAHRRVIRWSSEVGSPSVGRYDDNLVHGASRLLHKSAVFQMGVVSRQPCNVFNNHSTVTGPNCCCHHLTCVGLCEISCQATFPHFLTGLWLHRF